MIHALDEFTKRYEHLSQGTLKLLEQLRDEDLNRTVAEGHRTLGGLAWHLVITVPEMMSRTGLRISGVDARSMPPDSAAEIVRAYRAVSRELLEAVRTGWTDETLLETDDMYGETWPRGFTLHALIEHEVHHRGQMTVLLRQAGRRVPGLYGPAKEDWSSYGQPEPPY